MNALLNNTQITNAKTFKKDGVVHVTWADLDGIHTSTLKDFHSRGGIMGFHHEHAMDRRREFRDPAFFPYQN